MGKSTVNINFRIDAELKTNLEHACKELGLTPTAAFTRQSTAKAQDPRDTALW